MSDQSKYCYKNSDVLINKLGITDEAALNQAEADITNIKLMKLEANPIKGNFDLQHCQKIHKYLFNEIYPFAGQLREENIGKDSFKFAMAQFIKPAAEDIFKKLRKENFLKGKALEEFSDRAAYYMSELNVLHPFREGNGRTQREFVRTLAGKCGYKLDWSKVPKDQLMSASIKSIVDPKELANVIKGAIENKEPLKEIMKVFEKGIEMER